MFIKKKLLFYQLYGVAFFCCVVLLPHQTFAQAPAHTATAQAQQAYLRADTAFKNFQVTTAAAYAGQSLQAYRRAYAGGHAQALAGAANSAVLLGKALHHLQLYDSALAAYALALRWRQQLHGPYHASVGAVHELMAMVWEIQQVYDSTLAYYRAMVAHASQKQPLVVAKGHRGLGTAYTKMGQFDSALSHHQQSMALLRQHLPQGHIELARGQVRLGQYHSKKYEEPTAIEYYKQALPVIEARYQGRPSIELAQLYEATGQAYCYTNAFEQALEFCLKAKDLFITMGNAGSHLGGLYNVLGITYLSLGQPRAAIAYQVKARELFIETLGPNNPNVAGLTLNIAFAYKDLKQFDSAMYFNRQAYAAMEANFSEYSYEMSFVYEGMGDAHRDLRQFTEALPYYQKTIEALRQSVGPTSNFITQLYLKHSEVYDQLHHFDSAFVYIQKALRHMFPAMPAADEYANPTLPPAYHYNDARALFLFKGRLFLKRYHKTNSKADLEGALTAFMYCDTVVQHSQQMLQKPADIIAFHSATAAGYQEGMYTAIALHATTGQASYLAQAHYYAEKNKAGQLMANLANNRALVKANVPDSVKQHEQALQREIASLRRELGFEPAVPAPPGQADPNGPLVDQLFALNRQYSDFIEVIEKQYPAYHRLKYQQRIFTLDELQQRLNDQTALLSYALGADASFVFVVTRQAVHIVGLAPEAQLLAAADGLYNALQNEAPFTELAPAAHAAYQLLVAPAARYLQGQQRLVVAHPALPGIPFEAFLQQMPSATVLANEQYGAASFLLRQYHISYHYSATLWGHTQATEPQALARPALLAMAPFSEGQGRVVTARRKNRPLPQSKEEVSVLYNMFNKKGYPSTACFAAAANIPYLLANAQAYDVLHIATHSETSFTDQNLARIHLAGCLGQGNDHSATCLYPASIYTMNLSARLVVLSSCDSGAGKVLGNEGIMSLGRAFLNAGARNVVSTLWEADDRYSRLLMEAFYRAFLYQNKPFAEALAQAKTTLVAEAQWQHPKYWSNFILIGS